MVKRKHLGVDRRLGEDRRKAYDIDYFLGGGVERRDWMERRSPVERREGWLRVSDWVSVSVRELGFNKVLR